MKEILIWSVVKKVIIWVFCIPLSVFFCYILLNLIEMSLAPYQVTSAAISVHQSETNNNMNQNNAAVDFFAVNGTMYYLIKNWPDSLGLRTNFSAKLCMIENGQIHVLEKAAFGYGSDDRFIYYEFDDQLMAYDTQLKKASVLTQLPEYTIYDVVSQSDGTIVFFEADTDTASFSVQNGTMLKPQNGVSAPNRYFLGEKEYSVRNGDVYCQGEDISEQFGSASFRAIVPYHEGLLLINDGYGNLMYYIQEDGQIINLFPEFTCFCSESSINFYEHYIFVSILRYEGWGELGLGMKVFENDQFAGTYRIDIRDFSIEKINDKIYSGMYIFDDSGIYTCNRDGDISKISFNGEELLSIVD